MNILVGFESKKGIPSIMGCNKNILNNSYEYDENTVYDFRSITLSVLLHLVTFYMHYKYINIKKVHQKEKLDDIQVGSIIFFQQ